MPDYCLCNGGSCPRKNDCFRFRAIPDPFRQTFFETAPSSEGGACDYFMHMEGWPYRMFKEVGPSIQKTTVVNLTIEDYDISITRGSKWGNPFVIGPDGDRQTVFEKFRVWIQQRPNLLAALPELVGKRLGCYCKPNTCHGDVLIELMQERNLIT